MAKMAPKFIILCSAAIGAVYTAGYAITEPSAKAHVEQSRYQSGAQVSNSASSVKEQQMKYKDGTYTGLGMNSYGSVEVAVTIKNNRIVDVRITNCDTHYSERYIDSLPAQVVSRQSADVDVVSGATASTEDFQMAVQDALNKASGNKRSSSINGNEQNDSPNGTYPPQDWGDHGDRTNRNHSWHHEYEKDRHDRGEW